MFDRLTEMRLAKLVIALAACAPAAQRGPAWPSAAERPADGGESLAPHAAAAAIAAAEDGAAAERTDADPTPATGDATVTPASSAPSIDAPTGTVSEEPLTLEEVIIEIEDKDE
jgi:hypothetical protein